MTTSPFLKTIVENYLLQIWKEISPRGSWPSQHREEMPFHWGRGEKRCSSGGQVQEGAAHWARSRPGQEGPIRAKAHCRLVGRQLGERVKVRSEWTCQVFEDIWQSGNKPQDGPLFSLWFKVSSKTKPGFCLGNYHPTGFAYLLNLSPYYWEQGDPGVNLVRGNYLMVNAHLLEGEHSHHTVSRIP